MSRYQSEDFFQQCLRKGKQVETYAVRNLIKLGFLVKDISMELVSEGRYSPFDLLASKGDAVFVIDVKSRAWSNMWFTRYDLLAWELYDTAATKLILFHHILLGQYITVQDIKNHSYVKDNCGFTLFIDLKYTKDIRGLMRRNK
jgi:hypothetical protein